jgi:hypothetical protein
MEHTKLPLTTWFLAIHLISQAKTGISALALKRDLGVSYPTAWLLHHKINSAMSRQEAARLLGGAVQLDDAYLGGERRPLVVSCGTQQSELMVVVEPGGHVGRSLAGLSTCPRGGSSWGLS